MNIKAQLLLLACSFIFVSCVKDTDFNQVDDVVFTPEIELDLIYFNLDASEFFDQTANTPRLTIRDTTALEFLDDTAITGSIKKIDFLFNFNNSIPRTFEVDFKFLRENDNSTYTTGTIVRAGSSGNPEPTIFTEEIEGENLNDIESASKVVVSVTIPAANADLSGTVTLQSKAIYYLEY